MKATIDGARSSTTMRGAGPARAAPPRLPARPASCGTRRSRRSPPTHRVVRFDARGFGGSAARRGPAHHGAHRRRRRLRSSTTSGSRRRWWAAARWAATRPSPSCGATRSGSPASSSRTRGRGPTRAEARRRTAPALAAKVLAEGASAAAEAFLPKLVGETTQRERPGLVAALAGADPRRPRRRGSPTRSTASPRARTRARRCRRDPVPTLVLVGGEDVLTPPAEAETMARPSRGRASRSCRGPATSRTWRSRRRSKARSGAS